MSVKSSDIFQSPLSLCLLLQVNGYHEDDQRQKETYMNNTTGENNYNWYYYAFFLKLESVLITSIIALALWTLIYCQLYKYDHLNKTCRKKFSLLLQIV